MNNDELKKKIVDIIQMKLQECPFQPLEITYCEAAGYVADALIAAGIGDVKEAEHRAEVAERAFKDICTNIAKDRGEDIDIEPFARTLYKYYISGAEKDSRRKDKYKVKQGGIDMIKTFIFVEDGSVDTDKLQASVGDDVLIVTYRQGAMPPTIQQPREPVSRWDDKSYYETREVLIRLLYGGYKMSKKLRREIERLYRDYYAWEDCAEDTKDD